MKTINPKEISVGEFHAYLLGAVTPRPIAFASTIDKQGNVNLSPFSFFNAFSANPPILVFSPARRVRNNTTKDTLDNVIEHPEVVINIVNYAMAEQTSLSSTEYEKGVNEFVKSGLTEVSSDVVKPPRVGESPVAFECKVNDVIPLGEEGGAGHLVICEILLAHFSEDILDESNKIDPYKLDVIARMGGSWYTRVNGDSLFEIPKPVGRKGIGVDNIDESIRFSNVLSGNDLGRLGNIEELPSIEAVREFRSTPEIADIFLENTENKESLKIAIHNQAKQFLQEVDVEKAWLTLLQIH